MSFFVRQRAAELRAVAKRFGDRATAKLLADGGRGRKFDNRAEVVALIDALAEVLRTADVEYAQQIRAFVRGLEAREAVNSDESPFMTFDDICHLFSLTSMDAFDDRMELNYMEEADYARKDAERELREERADEGDESLVDDEAKLQEVWDNAYTAIRDELTQRYINCVESEVEHELEKFGLRLVPIQTEQFYGYEVVPTTSWLYAVEQTREVVNAYGNFYFQSNAEFMDSGPYTPRDAVLGHSGYWGNYGAVDGDRSVKDRVSRCFDR